MDNVVKYILNQGADEVEAYSEISRTAQVTLEKNDLNTANDGVIGGMGIRVFKNKSIGFASGNVLEIEDGKKLGIKALKLAGKLYSKEWNFLPKLSLTNRSSIRKIPGIYDEDSCSFTTDEILMHSINFLDRIKDSDSRVMIDSGTFSGTYGTRGLVNSNGVAVSENANAFVWYTIGMPREGKDVGTLSLEYDYTIKKKNIDVDKTADRFVEKVISTIGAKKLTKKIQGDIILTPRAVSSLIIPTIMFSVSAENVHKKFSYFGDKIGQEVATDSLTIIDDGSLPNKISSSSFDREGVPHKKLKIIDNGILHSYMYDSLSANRANIESTGHGLGDWESRPSIGNTNIIVNSGQVSIEELRSDFKKGLIVDSISGDPNPISGDASLVIKSAQLIENGEIKPIKEATLNINIFKLINSIVAISKEGKELFSITIPAMKFNDVTVIS